MRRSIILTVAVLTAFLPAAARGQFKEGDAGGAKTGPAQAHKWRAGLVVTAVGGPCRNIDGYVPVPTEWPEQTVKIVSQEVSPGVRVSYQMVEGGIKVMAIHIPLAQANEETKALLTFEVNRSAQLLPDNKDAFELPNPKELNNTIHRYLGPSPRIETRDPKIRKAAKEIGVNKTKAWEHVEALYDWTRENVKYKTGGPIKGAAAALREGEAGHDDLTAVFVAVCRDANIPARMVWVPEFSYAEFYLWDKKHEGHWIPCSPAGTRSFGEMLDTNPILGKGDNFRPPCSPRERQRYLKECLTAKSTGQSGQLKFHFERKMVN